MNTAGAEGGLGPPPEQVRDETATLRPSSDPPIPVNRQVIDDLDAQLRRMTRRGFATAGLSMLAGFGAWRWLVSRAEEDGLIWPLRGVLQVNERLASAAFRATRLAPDFPRTQATAPRVNGILGMAEGGDVGRGFEVSSWRLSVAGGAAGGSRRLLSLDDIKALPRVEQTTELKCIEGWSTIVHWAGARLADLAALTGLASRSGRPYDPIRTPTDLFGYVGLATPDGGYYIGLDTPSALHAQTLLCYEMNGQALTPDHGAPLRLVIPVKYGIKNIKRIGTIRFSDRRPADYWAEQGYDWYAGH